MPRESPEDTAADWSRILWLDRQIRDDQYPNEAALRQEFTCSRRTAFNTIAFLRGSLRAPLKYSRQRRGYYYTDPTYGLPTVFLQEGELLGLLLAEQVSRQYLGTPLEAPLREAVGKLRRYLPDTVAVEVDSMAEVFRFGGGAQPDVPLALVLTLRQAIRERRWVHLRYYTAHRGEWNERDVEPHFLRNVRGDWMLVAWDHLRGEGREFMLTRIAEYRLLDRRFVPRPELSPEAYEPHVFLTERGGEPFEVVLRFNPYQSRWIRERTWHTSQCLEEHPDGSVTLRLTVSGEGDLRRWILSYGSHVEVKEPSWLRERIAEELKRAAGLYGLIGVWFWW